MKIKIRKLKKQDIPACLKIVLKTNVSSSAKEAKKIMDLSLVKGIKFLNPEYYVLEIKGKITGISGLYYDYEDPKNVLWLDYLAVLPELQGKGYGSLMFENLTKVAKSKKIKMLCVFTDRQSAVDFYKSKSFEICGEIKNYYGTSKPKIWLYKNLK
jgi:N-acetylglutamate synthase-like GNAT family acetyltransferase